MNKLCRLVALFALTSLARAQSIGRIVVANDEWTLSDTGYSTAAAGSTDRFVQNVCKWFAGASGGQFLAWSANFGLTGSSFATSVNTNHTLTVDSVTTSPTMTLATLMGYDGVFVGGTELDIEPALLAQYVYEGGNVYICGGTGTPGTQWHDFLQPFGLAFASAPNGVSLSKVLPPQSSSTHPLFQGVTELYQNNGHAISQVGGGLATQILLSDSTGGQYAAVVVRCRHLFVANDDWTLSNTGFTNASPSTANYARNLANWFTGNVHGNFLVHSNNFGLTGSTLAATMTGAGHCWYPYTGPLSPAQMMAYDGVFIGGDEYTISVPDVLAYYQAGGNVYVLGGTAGTAAFNPLLQACGLQFGSSFNTIAGNVAISSTHPVLSPGVTALYQANGSSIIDLDTSSGGVVLVTEAGQGLYAAHEPGCSRPSYSVSCTRNGCCFTVNFVNSPGSGIASAEMYLLWAPSTYTSASTSTLGATATLTTTVDTTVGFPAVWDSTSVTVCISGYGENALVFRMRDSNGNFIGPAMRKRIVLPNSCYPMTADPSTPYCFATVSVPACPCGNDGADASPAGCLNSLGMGGVLGASGTASLSSDTVVLQASGLTNGICVFFQGTDRSYTDTEVPLLGDGLLCVGGSIVRLGTRAPAGGAAQYPGPGNPTLSVRGDVLVPGTRVYQVWYRNSANYCTSATFNTTSAAEILWTP